MPSDLMKITVDISLYPLTENYREPIRDFIARLKTHPEVELVTNATSTQLVGEHSKVFEILSKETEATFQTGQNIFVLKIIGFERDIHKIKS